MVVRALRVGALFLPVVCPWAREGDRAALIALYEATEGAGWATNAEYAGDDPYYNQSWIGGNTPVNAAGMGDRMRPTLNASLSFGEKGKMLGEMWKQLSDAEQRDFAPKEMPRELSSSSSHEGVSAGKTVI